MSKKDLTADYINTRSSLVQIMKAHFFGDENIFTAINTPAPQLIFVKFKSGFFVVDSVCIRYKFR